MLGLFLDVSESNYGTLAAILVVLLGTIGHLALLSTSRSIVHPAFLYCLIAIPLYVIFPTIQILLGQYSPHHQATPELSFMASAALVFAFTLPFGFGIRAAQKKASTDAAISRPAPREEFRAIRFVVLLAIGVGSAAWIYFFHRVGGLLEFIQNVQNKTKLVSGFGYLMLTAHFLQVGTLVAFSLALKKKPVLPRWALLGCIITSTFVFTVLAMRARIIMYVMMIAIVYVATKKVRRVRIFVFIALTGVALIFLLGRIRSLGVGGQEMLQKEEIRQAVNVDAEMALRQLTTDFSAFERLSLVYEITGDVLPLQWGKTIYAVLLLPLPSSFFPNKPTGSGPLVANALVPGSWNLEKGWATGVTVTTIGELYLNFWWPGVIIGGLFLGMLAGAIFVRYLIRRPSMWSTIKYSMIIVCVFIAGINGEWYGVVIEAAVYLVPLYLIEWICRARMVRSLLSKQPMPIAKA